MPLIGSKHSSFFFPARKRIFSQSVPLQLRYRITYSMKVAFLCVWHRVMYASISAYINKFHFGKDVVKWRYYDSTGNFLSLHYSIKGKCINNRVTLINLELGMTKLHMLEKHLIKRLDILRSGKPPLNYYCTQADT